MMELAARTWGQIELGERTGLRIGEESLTDHLLLDIVTHFPEPTALRKWNRTEEGALTGADWDWWFVDRKLRRGVGLRIQAKRINWAGERFTGFDQRNKRGVQRETLRRSAELEGLYPVYCLYLASASPPPGGRTGCGSFASDEAPPGWAGPAESIYGCSLLGLEAVELALRMGDTSLAALWPELLPWSCLTCCTAFGTDPIVRIDAQARRLQERLTQRLTVATLITEELPEEVIAIATGEGEFLDRGGPADVGATMVTRFDSDQG